MTREHSLVSTCKNQEDLHSCILHTGVGKAVVDMRSSDSIAKGNGDLHNISVWIVEAGDI